MGKRVVYQEVGCTVSLPTKCGPLYRGKQEGLYRLLTECHRRVEGRIPHMDRLLRQADFQKGIEWLARDGVNVVDVLSVLGRDVFDGQPALGRGLRDRCGVILDRADRRLGSDGRAVALGRGGNEGSLDRSA